MNAQEIIQTIAESKKKTPVKVYLKEKSPLPFQNVKRFGDVVFGDWEDIQPVLEAHADLVEDILIENDCRNSAIPMLEIKNLKARIEPGAIIRDHVEIKDNAIIMMGAILNIGAQVGEGTMIDMGAVLGGRAIVKDRCHIGANAVLAGVIEPASATPVIIENDVMVGAGAVILEGVHVGENAVIAAGAVVTSDVPANAIAAGVPARVIKMKDEKTTAKTAMVDALRSL